MTSIAFRRAAAPFLLAAGLALAACGDKADEGAASGNSAAPAGPAVPAPAGGWAEQVRVTADGGMLMGNPDAPVKLIEFASMTCPHCADFQKTGGQQIENQYVASGRVSYEFRNYVRDPYDLAASLLARCGGPGPFFKLTAQMLAAQEEWMGKLQAMPPAEEERLSKLPPAQMVPALAQAAGLDAFVAQRGIGADKARQCLTSQAAQDQLIAMRDKGDAMGISGTPTFFVNGEKVDGADWLALEPKLRAAGG